MNRLLTILALLTASSLQLSAYVPFINEDRVWQYIQTRDLSSSVYVESRHFDGTIEVNGKTYHRFAAFESKSYSKGLMHPEIVDTELIEDDRKATFYREEGETLYVLTGSYGTPVTACELDDQDQLREAIIMDFSIEQGGAFPKTFFTKYPVDSYVKYLPTEMVGGEECRRYKLAEKHDDYLSDLNADFVEGLGLIDSAEWMPFVQLYWTTSITSHNNFLGRLLSDSGEVLWESDMYHNLSGATYTPFINKDRVWQYVDENSSMCGSDNIYPSTDVVSFHFEGTTEVNGLTYHRSVPFEATHYPRHLWHPEVAQPGIIPDIVNYYREEKGVLYTLLDSSGSPVTEEIIVDGVVTGEFGEGIVMDFRMQPLEEYPSTYYTGEKSYYVYFGSKQIVEGKEWFSLGVFSSDNPEVPDFQFVQGIGSVKSSNVGWMPVLGTINTTAYDDHEYYLGQVLGADGQPIWQSETFRNLATVETIGAADFDQLAKPEYYTVDGLRVTDPRPGQLLIRRTGTRVEKLIYR